MLELSSAMIGYLHNSILPPWPWCIRQVDLFVLHSLGDDDDDDDVQFLKHDSSNVNAQCTGGEEENKL